MIQIQMAESSRLIIKISIHQPNQNVFNNQK